MGHSYSRAKVKFNVNRVDNMIIQSIALLDQLDKDINTFTMRVKEWYSWHFPELLRVVSDNVVFARCVIVIGSKATLGNDDKLEALTEAADNDVGLAEEIIAAARSSMGQDISEFDLEHVINFTERVLSLAAFRDSLHSYLKDKMAAVAPNLGELIGEHVGARLISHAGSLTNLAKYPASTVQILGAEKALFRALKTKGNTPKYGLIYHSSFIGRAAAKHKGRISRYVANKCSIAARLDAFSDEPTSRFGARLKDQVEERLQFYATGKAPTRNVDVMAEVVAELKAEGIITGRGVGKKRTASAAAADSDSDSAPPAKRAKQAEASGSDSDEPAPKKSKKSKKSKKGKKKSKSASAEAAVAPVAAPSSEKKKKKKKKKSKK